MFNNLRLIDKIILFSGGFVLLLFAIYLILKKHPARHFILPENYCGWVTIKYQKRNAPPLPEQEGNILFEIPENGILLTSNQLNMGWGKDLFFRKKGTALEQLPNYVDIGDEKRTFIHQKSYEFQKFDSILAIIPPFTDTLLEDGSLVEMQDTSVDITRGNRVLQHFYVSCEPQPYHYKKDSLPESRKYW